MSDAVVESKKSNKRVLIIGLIVGAVVIIGCIIGAIIYGNGASERNYRK